jgi:hypothetical protein
MEVQQRDRRYEVLLVNELTVGQTYSREEINALFGAPEGCECRIVAVNPDGTTECECGGTDG